MSISHRSPNPLLALAGRGAASEPGTGTSGAPTGTGSSARTAAGSRSAPGRLVGTARALPPRRRSTLLPATLVGLLIGLVVAVGGLAAISRQPVRWSATASLLVLPERTADAATVAGLYDSLSSGQVVESYRAVMASPGFSNGVLDSLALSPRARSGVTPDVHVVPSTALVDATVTADDAATAEKVADGLADRAAEDLSKTFTPYRITVVSGATGTAEKSGPSAKTLGAVVVLLALVVAVVAQQAVLFVAASRERAAARRRRPAAGAATSGRLPDTAAADR